MNSGQSPETVASLDHYVRFLRRYARALTGSQSTGDRYALAALEAAIEEPSILTQKSGPKVALFNALHMFWGSSGAPLGEPDTALSARAQMHMARLTPFTREAILLHSIEGFSLPEIAEIMNVPPDEASRLINVARREMQNSIAGRVLIIEDEAIIALDLASIVEEIGHTITGVARTRTEAVELAHKTRPDLILADIQLADKSSGVDAVNDIMSHFSQIPVIFITAFPERLLTGTKPEPAFLIAKPFSEDQVRLAVSQALFFATTETLEG
jgi:CheY-like chemotaxis protein